ncbi:hypothetical protein B9G99_08165 [Kushneria konosiri]|uniref:Uncharacterized protein n=1 Tax=Kushneria konosiri TaxID=698828 RepID=A0A2Z2H6D2_9GAMM|nr:hypothetical protein B9G99_08165 [Kushneria konosiri]
MLSALIALALLALNHAQNRLEGMGRKAGKIARLALWNRQEKAQRERDLSEACARKIPEESLKDLLKSGPEPRPQKHQWPSTTVRPE